MFSLFRYAFKGTGTRLALAIFCSLLSGLANIALANRLTQAAEGHDISIALFLGLLVTLVGTIVLSRAIVAKLAAARAYELTMEMSRRLVAMPIRQLERIGTDDTLATLTNDIPRIANGVQEFASLITNALTLFLLFAYAFYISVIGGLLLTGVGLVLLMLGIAQVYFLQGNVRTLRASLDDFYRHFSDLLFGAKELRLGKRTRDDFLANGLGPTARRSMDASIGMGIKNAIFGSMSTVLIFLCAAAIIALGYSTFGMPIETVRAYVLLIMFAAAPGAGVLFAGATIQMTALCFKRVTDIAADFEDEQALPTTERAERVQVDLENARVSYTDGSNDEEFTLGPLDLTFSPGKITFIIGGNGSGKSTLIKVLAGIYALDGGALSLNGVDVTAQTTDAYRNHISVVFSDFWLFDTLWGYRQTSNESIRQWLVKLQLEEKTVFEHGSYSTIDLSAGQRRRLALIAALIEDRPIYIFDEWAADQDPRFTRYFYRTLLPSLRDRGKTVIVVTHDEAYFDVADERIKLEYGQVTRETTSRFMIQLAGEDNAGPAAPSEG